MSNKVDFLSKGITALLNEISQALYESRFKHIQERILYRANAVLGAINSHDELFCFLSKVHRSDFVDCLFVHRVRYIREYKRYNHLEEEGLLFEQRSEELIKKLSDTTKFDSDLTNKELEDLSEEFYKIIKKIQDFWPNQKQNEDTADYINLSSMISRINSINPNIQESLIDLLMIVKEIWRFRNLKDSEISISEQLYTDPNSYVQVDKQTSAIVIFDNIINLITNATNTPLLDLTDEEILHLYDRLKSYQLSESLTNFMHKLYAEAQLRYSYHRLSEVGYKLLNRFQSFDALNHKVESLEFSVLESYLLKKNNFHKEISLNLLKHTDNIKILSLNKNEHLDKVLNCIHKKLQRYSRPKDSDNVAFANLKDTLDKIVPQYIKKRYAGLDKFMIDVLQDKYDKLFQNIVNLFEENEKAESFLHEKFSQRLACEYYLPSLSNSLVKLRAIALNRKNAEDMFSKINLVNIFKPECFNKITSFSFKTRQADILNLKTPIEYVELVIDGMVKKSNAFQLEVLYKLAIDNKEVDEAIREMIINGIKVEIHQRSNIRNLVYSIISGKKREYDKLRNLKRISNQVFA